jgi:voltage-gated potassium channel
VALYYLLPLDHAATATTELVLAAGLVVLAGIAAWEVRAIVGADYPVVRAIEALGFTVPLFLLLFSMVYFLMEHHSPGNFSQPLTRTDALYFTVTTFSTVGYGDITARSQAARLVVTLQMLADLVVLGFGVKVFLGAAQTGRRRRGAARATASGAVSAPAEGGEANPTS